MDARRRYRLRHEHEGLQEWGPSRNADRRMGTQCPNSCLSLPRHFNVYGFASGANPAKSPPGTALRPALLAPTAPAPLVMFVRRVLTSRALDRLPARFATQALTTRTNPTWK